MIEKEKTILDVMKQNLSFLLEDAKTMHVFTEKRYAKLEEELKKYEKYIKVYTITCGIGTEKVDDATVKLILLEKDAILDFIRENGTKEDWDVFVSWHNMMQLDDLAELMRLEYLLDEGEVVTIATNFTECYTQYDMEGLGIITTTSMSIDELKNRIEGMDSPLQTTYVRVPIDESELDDYKISSTCDMIEGLGDPLKEVSLEDFLTEYVRCYEGNKLVVQLYRKKG